MLALTLEKISRSKDAPRDVRIFLDWGVNGRLAEVEYVRDTYLPTADIFEAQPHIKVLSGTYNILNSLKAGWETGKEFIFLIEEDILVSKCFFEWHWAAHESDNYFVTCGRRHFHMPSDFYSNPGTCYRHKSFAHVVPHITEKYFQGTEKYVDSVFPQYRGQDGSLDDGLIRKVQRSVAGKVKCAEPRVCAHVGFHHYQRLNGYVNDGKTMQEKIDKLREILSRVDPKNRHTSDFEILEENT
jgi:hypothetical protein